MRAVSPPPQHTLVAVHRDHDPLTGQGSARAALSGTRSVVSIHLMLTLGGAAFLPPGVPLDDQQLSFADRAAYQTLGAPGRRFLRKQRTIPV